jgi:hypothetical protein
VALLPGTDAPLTNEQLKQAFYDGMPTTWKERFVNSGSRFNQMTNAEIVRYFRSQESQALTKQRENEDSQRRTARNKKRSHGDARRPQNKKKVDDKNSSQQNKRQKGRISDDDPCPVHPGSNHNWGECRANHFGKQNKKEIPGSNKGNSKDKKKADHFVATVVDNDPPNNSSGEGTDTHGCFIVETMVQLDKHLTSNFIAELQTNEYRDHYVSAAYCTALEDCFAIGIDNNEIVSSNSTPFTHHSLLAPIGIMTVQTIQGLVSKKPLKVLFDSGSHVTLINPKAIPKGATPQKLDKSISLYTGGGTVEAKYGITMKGLRFPELSPTRMLDKPITAIVNTHTCDYDVILGTDVLCGAGIDVKASTHTIHWGDVSCSWQTKDILTDANLDQHARVVLDSVYTESERDSFAMQMSTREILSSKYDKVETNDVAQQQHHLSQRQRDDLAGVLQNFSTLFSGKLGCYPHQKVHLELDNQTTPFSCRPYPVPDAHKRVFKQELDRLVELGVLSPTGPAKYLSPTFIIPKKDGRVRWVSDFRKLNSMITRKVYHLPRIQDILRKRSKYQFFTKLDISMQYYTFELDDESKELCTICTPFGNYCYNRLPMGVKQSPDIAQQVMEELLRVQRRYWYILQFLGRTRFEFD